MERRPTDTLDERSFVLVAVAKRQWERTFDAIADPLMIIDESFVVRRANLALADDLGTAIQRVVGRRCHEVRAESPHAFAPDEKQGRCAGCPVAQARDTGQAALGEVRSRSGRVYRLRAFPLEDEAGRLTVCSYHDVTDERELAKQLAGAERLASVGRLAGGVAHEINNPLAGILAFAQILLRDEALPADERRECLREIESSALRCKTIVESLLRFAQQTPRTDLRAVDLSVVVRDGVKQAAYRASLDGVEISYDLATDLPPVQGEARQLEQVVANLVLNAADGARTATATPRVGVRTEVRGGNIELSVSDNGPGVPEGPVERLFEPFFSTKEEPSRATGLGLAVTYAIVREHGGQITVRNGDAGGAVFTVSLPIAR